MERGGGSQFRITNLGWASKLSCFQVKQSKKHKISKFLFEDKLETILACYDLPLFRLLMLANLCYLYVLYLRQNMLSCPDATLLC